MNDTRGRGREAGRPVALLTIGFRPFYLLAGRLRRWRCLFGTSRRGSCFPASPYLAGAAWHAHEMVFGFAAAVLTGFLLTAARAWSGLDTLTGWRLAALAGLWVAGRVLVATGPAVPAIVVDCLVPALRRVCRGAPRPEGAELPERARGGGAGPARRGEPAVPPGPCGPHRACAGQRRRAAGPRSLRAARHADGRARDPGVHRQRGAGGPAAAETPTWRSWLSARSGSSWLPARSTPGCRGDRGSLEWRRSARLAHSVRLWLWDPAATRREPLLWVLPLSYAWLPAALILRSLWLAGADVPAAAAFHALGAGAMGGLMLGMMTRSALGHTGRPARRTPSGVGCLRAGSPRRGATGLRPARRRGGRGPALAASAVLWSGAFALFFAAYFPVLTRPRIDEARAPNG